MTEEITEPAKAVTEVAKTTGKAIDASREFGGWFSKFIEYPAEQASGIVGDSLKYIRMKRQVAYQDKVNEIMEARGLKAPTQPIPLKIAMPLLQASTIEDDDNLQELWANLLVNAADKDSGVEVRRSYISILEELTYFDAQMLDKIYSIPLGDGDHVWTHGLPQKAYTFESQGYHSDELKVVDKLEPTEDVALSLEVLCRLGLLESLSVRTDSRLIKGVFQTVLGRKFYEACTDNA